MKLHQLATLQLASVDLRDHVGLEHLFNYTGAL